MYTCKSSRPSLIKSVPSLPPTRIYLLSSVPADCGAEGVGEDEHTDEDRERGGDELDRDDCLRGVVSVPSDLTLSSLLLSSLCSVATRPENSLRGVIE